MDWPAVTARLDEIAALPADWDGMGAAAPNPAAIRDARRWLVIVADWSDGEEDGPGSVYAVPGGEVVMTWQNDGYMEGEFAGDGTVDWFQRKSNGEEEQWTGELAKVDGQTP